MTTTPKKMNKRVKAKWLKALRSGKYKQTAGKLKNSEGYCCLGVLCQIKADEDGKGISRYKARDAYLPNGVVVEWAGLTERSPRIKGRSLHLINDFDGKSFEEIADLIEDNL